jgi:hypothetical protein
MARRSLETHMGGTMDTVSVPVPPANEEVTEIARAQAKTDPVVDGTPGVNDMPGRLTTPSTWMAT